MKLAILILTITALLFGQSATPITYPAGSSPSVVESQAIPVTPTVITTGNLIFGGGWVSCNATGRSVLITDGNGIIILPSVAITANQIVSLTSVLAGAYVSKGFSISASGTGCTYSIWWRN